MKLYTRQLENFRRCYGEAHFNLACHLSMPLSFSPMMAYATWINFKADLWPDWFAVADICLSRLVREVSYDSYEIDTETRALLLRHLEQRFGQQRVMEAAQFLRHLATYEPDKDMAEAQQWLAQSYLEPISFLENISAIWQQSNSDDQWRINNLNPLFPLEIRAKLEMLI